MEPPCASQLLGAKGVMPKGGRERPARITRERRGLKPPVPLSRPIDRAADAQRPSIQNVLVDHRRRHVGMPEEFLYGANVVAVLDQVRGK